MPKFGRRSRGNLITAHTDLQRLFNEVIKHFDCSVLCGHRNREDQNKAFAMGFSKLKWPKGNHNKIPSRAVDVLPWFKKRPHLRWKDKGKFREFGGFVLGVASQMRIKIRWGGHWRKSDFPHYELRRF